MLNNSFILFIYSLILDGDKFDSLKYYNNGLSYINKNVLLI